MAFTTTGNGIILAPGLPQVQEPSLQLFRRELQLPSRDEIVKTNGQFWKPRMALVNQNECVKRVADYAKFLPKDHLSEYPRECRATEFKNSSGPWLAVHDQVSERVKGDIPVCKGVGSYDDWETAGALIKDGKVAGHHRIADFYNCDCNVFQSEVFAKAMRSCMRAFQASVCPDITQESIDGYIKTLKDWSNDQCPKLVRALRNYAYEFEKYLIASSQAANPKTTTTKRSTTANLKPTSTKTSTTKASAAAPRKTITVTKYVQGRSIPEKTSQKFEEPAITAPSADLALLGSLLFDTGALPIVTQTVILESATSSSNTKVLTDSTSELKETRMESPDIPEIRAAKVTKAEEKVVRSGTNSTKLGVKGTVLLSICLLQSLIVLSS